MREMITVGEAVAMYEKVYQGLREIIDLDDTIPPEFRREVHKLIDEHLLLAKEGVLQLADRQRGRRR
jgi:hypothetical protein